MLSFECKKFDSFSPQELHDLLALRSEVFVVEQNCVYQDIDGKDLLALHIIGKSKEKTVACARILAPGVSYPEKVSIGRVAVSQTQRGKNQGHELMNYCLKQTKAHFPAVTIKISAQAHLENFYNKHGFKATGEEYLEDGIPHIGMIL
tara:strand:+ start:7234 stop:7677 length:444 start_codon:yes stop_codon:yes gene_type:complete